jgi:nicotinamidase-related amidase
MKAEEFLQRSRPFLEWLVEWYENLPALSLAEIDPAATMVLSVDLIRGFCTEGPLASPRVQGIVPAVVRLFQMLYDHGVRHFVLTQDTHSQQTPEFEAFGRHCLAGTTESETIPELLALPFSDQFVIFPKNSLSSMLGTGLPAWLEAHPEVKQFIIVGDCTDLCIYTAAMDLRLRANAFNIPGVQVIVPADCVQTYDLSVETARQLGIMPHDGDFLHRIFLYMMALNGVKVVAQVVP